MSSLVAYRLLIAIAIGAAILVGLDYRKYYNKIGGAKSVPHTAIIVIAVFVTRGLIALLYLAFRPRYKRMYNLMDATERLQSDLNNSTVNNYINLINNSRIPNELVIWNNLRAGYSLVKSSKNVDGNVKERLKVVMLSKGVNGIY